MSMRSLENRTSFLLVGLLLLAVPANASAQSDTRGRTPAEAAPDAVGAGDAVEAGDAIDAGDAVDEVPEDDRAPVVLEVSPPPQPPKSKWYERLSLRGYTQVRYNRLGETNPRLVNVQADRSQGEDGGFLIRRARLVISGDVSDHVYVYLQPDFASFIGSTGHVGLMRDWYADIAVDSKKEFRFRVGQSKIPFGFENLQSSSNRLPLDRSDPINSALKDERDIGVFFMWTPEAIRARFKHLASRELKGTGDYGAFAFGAFNGQNANKAELNDTPHLVARLTWPFLLGKQYLEVGGGAYAGWYVGSRDDNIGGHKENLDARGVLSFTLYPQPFGLQAEYNVGVGPALRNDAVESRFLHGGYVLASLNLGAFLPFVRGAYYEGGKKHETNAPSYSVREVEFGVEWQIMKALELTAAWNIAERTFPEAPYPQESGMLGRLQLQVNY